MGFFLLSSFVFATGADIHADIYARHTSGFGSSVEMDPDDDGEGRGDGGSFVLLAMACPPRGL